MFGTVITKEYPNYNLRFTLVDAEQIIVDVFRSAEPTQLSKNPVTLETHNFIRNSGENSENFVKRVIREGKVLADTTIEELKVVYEMKEILQELLK